MRSIIYLFQSSIYRLVKDHVATLYILLTLTICLFQVRIVSQCSVSFSSCPTVINIIDCDHTFDEAINFTLPIATAVGFCSNFTLTRIYGPAPGSNVPLGTYAYRYMANAVDINNASNPHAFCDFIVNVIADVQPPIFTYCPPNITIHGTDDGTGNCTSQGYWVSPTSTDNCSGHTISGGSSPCGSSFPKGTTTVSYTTTDPSGNTATCSFTVTVICTTPTETVSKSYKEVFIHPNPAKESLIVDLGEPAISGESLRIVDFTGKILSERSVDAGNPIQTMETWFLPSGIYLLQISYSGQVQYVDKFIKL